MERGEGKKLCIATTLNYLTLPYLYTYVYKVHVLKASVQANGRIQCQSDNEVWSVGLILNKISAKYLIKYLCA